MALIIEKQFKGFDCTYFKILTNKTMYMEGKTIVYIGVYKDEAARRADENSYLYVEAVTLPAGDMGRPEMYAAIKDIYPDAIDV